MNLELFSEDWFFEEVIEPGKIDEFILVLKELKENKNNKEFLEKFKSNINDVYFLDFLDKGESTNVLIELFVYFGYNKEELIRYREKTYSLFINKKFFLNKDNYKEYPSLISLFEVYNKLGFDCLKYRFEEEDIIEDNIDNPGGWLEYLNNEQDGLLKLFRKWREFPPEKIILEDFKTVLNSNSYIFIDSVKKYITYDSYDFFKDLGYRIEDPYYFAEIYFEERKEIFDSFIEFGYEITREDIKEIKNLEDRKSTVLNQFTRIEAGKKIARFIEDKMDDEFHLSELRKRIEKRRFEDLMKENKN
jgi:hypothetical protein